MSQATVIEHISLKDLSPHVISYLSSYPPSERCRIIKKLLAYAVSKLEVVNSNEWSIIVPKRMVDEMTQTSDAYVRIPEKMPKGTRGYKKLFAGHKKLIGSEFEKATVISVSSSTEPSSSDTLSSENEDNAMNMHKKDPFFVASTKKSAMNFLKKQQQTKKLLRSPSTPQTPTQICVSKPDKHQSTHLLKHKRTVKVASKNPLKGKDKATTCSTPKVKYRTTVEIADEFLESTFMAYLEPSPKEGDDLERNNDLEEIIYKARQKLSNNSGEFLAAFDVNTTANSVYKHNLEKDKRKSIVQQRSIESLPLSYYDSFNANIWLMSPPCQPYTRMGLHQGSSDPRAKSFLYLIDMLSKMSFPPTYILIENVKGFEESDTRNTLVTQLKNCNYNFQEFFITPLQLGIPNSRLRYYLLAKKQPLDFRESDSKILHYIPCSRYNQRSNDIINILNNEDSDSLLSNINIRPISDFLQDDVNYEKYSIPNKTLIKYGKLFDIVKPSSHRSCCFTKGYHHYVEATGSILQLDECLDSDQIFDNKKIDSPISEKTINSILKLRYFTEREVASIMGFPTDFSFPDELNLKQRYRVLGNSLNVRVVAELIKYLLLD
ncbi:hypothetical protein RclHR1_08530002 [Rhizophagus clarus]|uniref:tRNA (cytosine(38)-C(5))-methyltransferase n=1 Tax=Rhizophagus clarus TaxID=94130 RepID=A0A2Z6S3G4_9GLOM|nr:hypothetical protein RclHR1_08530002 [Rhizophagus clarus]